MLFIISKILIGSRPSFIRLQNYSPRMFPATQDLRNTIKKVINLFLKINKPGQLSQRFFFIRNLFPSTRLYIRGILNSRPAISCLVKCVSIYEVFEYYYHYYYLLTVFDLISVKFNVLTFHSHYKSSRCNFGNWINSYHIISHHIILSTVSRQGYPVLCFFMKTVLCRWLDGCFL